MRKDRKAWLFVWMIFSACEWVLVLALPELETLVWAVGQGNRMVLGCLCNGWMAGKAFCLGVVHGLVCCVRTHCYIQCFDRDG